MKNSLLQRGNTCPLLLFVAFQDYCPIGGSARFHLDTASPAGTEEKLFLLTVGVQAASHWRNSRWAAAPEAVRLGLMKELLKTRRRKKKTRTIIMIIIISGYINYKMTFRNYYKLLFNEYAAIHC